MKFLIFRPGALGDTVLCFPLLNSLKKNFNCEITFVGHRDYFNLVDFFGLGKGISIENRFFLRLFSELEEDKNLINFIKEFDYIIYISKNQNDIAFEKLLRYYSNVIFCPSLPEIKIPIRKHFSHYIQKFLGFPNIYDTFYYNFANSDSNRILIHPGSGSPKKNWDIDNYYKIIEFLDKKKFKITIAEGIAEKNLNVLFKKFNVDFYQIKLPELIKKLKQFKFYIGNDSGITHLVSLSGVKGIAIFGNSDPWLWNPNPQIQCIYKIENKGISFPNVDEVIDFLEKFMPT